MLEDKLIRAIEEQRSLDRIADPVQHTVRAVLARAPQLEDFLHGRWLGHPLHAAIIPIPVGGWTVGLALDLTGALGGTRRYQRAADVVTAIGLGGAGMAVLAGLADWSLTSGKARRVGIAHALLNTAVASLYAASLAFRGAGRRSVGVALSSTGFGVAGVSAWLGGELAYRYGVGVSKVALEPARGGEAGRTSPELRERIEAMPH
jgi:uncharacterized membrane protein